ncbi:hypothetical protein B0H11DRAFT_1992207 [Mycena galericulata]|nr:hypothetical protein B0H11DRAFT_1992207 [Mycena galericulata]
MPAWIVGVLLQSCRTFWVNGIIPAHESTLETTPTRITRASRTTVLGLHTRNCLDHRGVPGATAHRPEAATAPIPISPLPGRHDQPVAATRERRRRGI